MVRVSVLVGGFILLGFVVLIVDQNDCLNNIVNAERRGKRQVLIRPSSKVVIKFLSVMQRHGTYTYDTSDYQNFPLCLLLLFVFLESEL